MKCVLAIAGSDSCGGAGIQADIKTITSLGAHALTVVTALTAQSSLGITAIHKVPARFVSRQIRSLFADTSPHAVKIGMLFSAANVREVARMIRKHEVSRGVLDPVLKASTGERLLEPDALPLLRGLLLPQVKVVTPNMDEASALTGMNVSSLRDMEKACRLIKEMGPDVVVTGGHLKGKCIDVLYDGKDMHHFHGERIMTDHTHGSGCVFSTALATFLAMDEDVTTATKRAHDFTRGAIRRGYPCGQGSGAVNPA